MTIGAMNSGHKLIFKFFHQLSKVRWRIKIYDYLLNSNGAPGLCLFLIKKGSLLIALD